MNYSRLWTFRAVDTWFFRDSASFQTGDNVMASQMIFPPSMSTLQGAIRTALATSRGWSPGRDADWPKELGTPDHLGDLKLFGPYVIHNGQPVFPAPQMVLMNAENSMARLVPGDVVATDFGNQQLPVPQANIEGLQDPDGYWVARDDLMAILNGDIPCTLLPQAELWSVELRVGLAMNMDTRTAIEGQLYQTAHIRPHTSTEIAVEVAGIPLDWHDNVPKVIPLGGEGRYATVSVSHSSAILPSKPDIAPSRDGKVRFTLTLVTPGQFVDTHRVQRTGPLDFDCVSAALSRVRTIGGWDLQRHRPRPPMPFMPAGSTWFYESSLADWQMVSGRHGDKIGNLTEYGYGQIVLGKWEELMSL